MEKFETNKILCGDCLNVMHKIPDESIDLVYLDPPFSSNARYDTANKPEEIAAFEDRWKGNINTFIIYMRERLIEARRILKPTGTIYLHCDWHAGHYLKIEMDKNELFGYDNYQSEIIWQRRETPFGQKKNNLFPSVHDSIFVYSKTNKFVVNKQFHEHSQKFIQKFNKNDNDERGQYRWVNLLRSLDKSFVVGKETKIGKTGIIYYKEFLSEHSAGAIVTNIWTDIDGLNAQFKRKEYLNYPTQKPEKLLKRIILASSNEGDIVLDPFSGSGTTIKVAQELNRQFVGIDISQEACKIAAQRINYPEYEILGAQISEDVLKQMNPWQFQQFVCDRMSAVNTSKSKNTASGGDGGADGVVRIKDEPGLFSGSEIYKKYNGALLQVKQSGAGINVVKNLYATLHSNNKKLGFIVAYNFPKTAFEEAANYKLEHDTDIRLIEVEKLCDPKFNPFT